ncbi:MAG: rhomboid family protein [Opitutaceae bacterium]|nr:rhomboid family protein [Opitutaceae bacterium]
MSTSTPRLVVSRCYNHADREASARCVSCGRTFCRECVAEHDGRMICGACLHEETAAPDGERRGWLGRVARAGQFVAAGVVAWLVFYFAGRMLLQVPAEFHEGTVWQGEWWQGER